MAIVVADEELFWKEIRKAVGFVETNHGLSYEIGIGFRNAAINWKPDDKSDFSGTIVIELFERIPDQPALLVP